MPCVYAVHSCSLCFATFQLSFAFFAGSFIVGPLFVSAGRVWGRGCFSPAASVARRGRHVVPWPSTARTFLPGSGEQPISATYVISLSLSLSLSLTYTKMSLCTESCTASGRYADTIRWTWTSSQCHRRAAATLLIGWLSQCLIPLPWEVPCPSEITTSSVAAFPCPFAAMQCLPNCPNDHMVIYRLLSSLSSVDHVLLSCFGAVQNGLAMHAGMGWIDYVSGV